MRAALKKFYRALKDRFTFLKLSTAASAGLSIVKFALAIAEHSYFIAVHGMYALAVAAAKALSLKGLADARGDRDQESKYYLAVAVVLTAATLFYSGYSVRHFFVTETFGYGTIGGITVAAISFAELFVAAISLKRTNKRGALLKSGLKCVNLSSAFTAIAFTQAAILSTSDPSGNYAEANATGGIMFGAASLVLCIAMFIKYLRFRRKYRGAPAEETAAETAFEPAGSEETAAEAVIEPAAEATESNVEIFNEADLDENENRC